MYLCCLLPLRDILPTVMARYSLFVLKVPLNPKQTNKQTLFLKFLCVIYDKHLMCVSENCVSKFVWLLCYCPSRTCLNTFRREHDRFWVLAAHPALNLFAAGL